MAHVLDVPAEFHLAPSTLHKDVVATWAERLVEENLFDSRLVRKLIDFWWSVRPQETLDFWRWVYVARSTGGIVKVGISDAPLTRIAGLRRDGQSFVPVGCVPYATLQNERQLLCLLDIYAERNGREWFRSCKEMDLFCGAVLDARDPRLYARAHSELGESLRRLNGCLPGKPKLRQVGT